jgi:hypothetical protein
MRNIYNNINENIARANDFLKNESEILIINNNKLLSVRHTKTNDSIVMTTPFTEAHVLLDYGFARFDSDGFPIYTDVNGNYLMWIAGFTAFYKLLIRNISEEYASRIKSQIITKIGNDIDWPLGLDCEVLNSTSMHYLTYTSATDNICEIVVSKEMARYPRYETILDPSSEYHTPENLAYANSRLKDITIYTKLLVTIPAGVKIV